MKDGGLTVIEGTRYNIDWQQVRIQAAIAAMQGILSNPSVPMLTKLSEEYQYTADLAVGYADALIEELKKEK